MDSNSPGVVQDHTQIKLIECSRDAMQGWQHFIPTEKKIEYINQLLKVGFHTIDFGSFVSPKSMPQMADTKIVVEQLNIENTSTKLLAIIANLRGAQDAAVFDKISYLGFPFSVSPTFQMRNTRSTIEQSFDVVKDIKSICDKNAKELVVYISMAFGNPYGDLYNEDVVMDWIRKLVEAGINIISLSDTVGVAESVQISSLVKKAIKAFPQIETGVHLHSTNLTWKQKTDAAFQNGCMRFDGALKGIGGCPMAGDSLVGNMDTELLIPFFKSLGLLPQLNEIELNKASRMASTIFV